MKKYTTNKYQHKYYENNKDTMIEKSKEYIEKIKNTNPDKLKEWRHNYYIKRKERLKNENNESNNN